MKGTLKLILREMWLLKKTILFIGVILTAFVAADENAHEDLGGVVDISLAEKSPVGGAHGGEAPVFVLPLDAGDLVGIYPRMSRRNAPFLPFFQKNFISHASIIE